MLHSLGRLVAQSVEQAPHIQKLCPHRSEPGFNSTLWSFAACHSPSLSPVSCLFFSCPVLIKAQKHKKNLKNKTMLHSLTCFLRHVQISNFSTCLWWNSYLPLQKQATYYSLIYTAACLSTLLLLWWVCVELQGEFTSSKHGAKDADYGNGRIHMRLALCRGATKHQPWVTRTILTLTRQWRACQLRTSWHLQYLALQDICCRITASTCLVVLKIITVD